MTTLIVCTSVSHGNTARIADAMASVLEAKTVTPDQTSREELDAADLVGFGSGIFNLDFHPALREFVKELPTQTRGRAFIFTTSGLPEPPFRRYSRRFAALLEVKGFTVIDTFACRGFDTWWPFKAFGGINKGRPDDTDLRDARAFAERLRRVNA